MSFSIYDLLLPYEAGFMHVGDSVLMTWVIMVGEMCYGDLFEFEDISSMNSNQWLVHVAFVMFLIWLSPIIMNLYCQELQ